MDINYDRYKFSIRELLLYSAIFVLIISIAAYMFFDSLYVFLVLLVFYPLFVTLQRKNKTEQRKKELKKQFCELISCISTSLNAGFSVENSFRVSIDEMVKTYGDKADITIELVEINRKLDIGVPLSVSLSEFANRARVEDISDFITVFMEATRSGGDLNEIIKNTVTIIQDKRRIEEEIEAMLKGKMLEQKVISVIPILIFIYLRLSSKDFIGVLYHNVTGICVMSLCLFVYFLSIIMSKKIVRIKV